MLFDDDPCCLARLPSTAFDEATGRYVSSSDPAQASALQIQACPIACSYAIVDGRHLLSDVNAFEASLASSTITVTLDVTRRASSNKQGDLVDIYCVGRCSALVSLQEARRAGVGEGDWEEEEEEETSEGCGWVKDEALMRVCLARARKEGAKVRDMVRQAGQARGAGMAAPVGR